jgi:hypothetical protein
VSARRTCSLSFITHNPMGCEKSKWDNILKHQKVPVWSKEGQVDRPTPEGLMVPQHLLV